MIISIFQELSNTLNESAVGSTDLHNALVAISANDLNRELAIIFADLRSLFFEIDSETFDSVNTNKVFW